MQSVSPKSDLFKLAAVAIMEDCKEFNLDKVELGKHMYYALNGRYSKDSSLFRLLQYFIVYDEEGWCITTKCGNLIYLEYIFVQPESDFTTWFKKLMKTWEKYPVRVRLKTKSADLVRAVHDYGFQFKHQIAEDKKLCFEYEFRRRSRRSTGTTGTTGSTETTGTTGTNGPTNSL